MAEETCQQCGSPLPASARFCPSCGAPVEEWATEERRVVTVLFADISGSTRLAAQLDPERFRELLSAFFRMASTELASLRGRAEKFVGDAVMAVFGLPHVHEDDALRAIRAAMIIRDRAARVGQQLGLPVPLQVHVGINSGPVAVGSGPNAQLLVSGSAVNVAARLQQAARPEETLVGDTTYQLARHAVEFGEPRTIPARGFDRDITAWPVLSLAPRSSRRAIPLVGRRRELTLLSDTFERAGETRRVHLVTVIGEPGIGKSRLVDEFLAGLGQEVKVLYGRTSEFEEDPSFAPIAQMVRKELGLDQDSPPGLLRERLKEVVSGCCEPDQTEQVVARLGLALGLGEDAREGRRFRAAEIRQGFHTFVTGLATRQPVVPVFEDLHAARPALLDLIEEVVRESRRIPVMVVCMARDWLLDQRPTWAGGISDAFTIRLEPLPFPLAKDLAMAAGEDLKEADAERIALHAGGNPFFIVETTGMLLHERLEHRIADPGLLLPPTVQAVVASRIDHLEDDAKDLVRKASVLARSSFTPDELAMVTEADQDVLERLEKEEILEPDPDRPDMWRFRHQMLRTVAYDSLPKRERLRLHLEVADRLIEQGEADRSIQTIAHHLAQAARASLDLDPTDRTLADRAVEALAKAGDHAKWRMESRTAVDLYRQALAQAGPEERWGSREAHLLTGIGEAQYWLADFEAAEAALRQALALAPDDPWIITPASRFLADIALNVRGDIDSAERLFDEAIQAARTVDDPSATARTLLMAGWAPYWRGDLDQARRMFEEALEIARSNPEGDRWGEARALVSIASIVSPTGSEPDCVDLASQALHLGEEMGDPFTVAVAKEKLAQSYRRMWRLDEALPLSHDAVRTFKELGARWELASSIGERGSVRRLLGRFDEAERDLRAALDLCRQLKERSLVAWTAAELAYVLFFTGDLEASRELLVDPAHQPSPGDAVGEVPMLAVGAVLDIAEGERDRALERTLRALELVRAENLPNPVASRTWWAGSLFGAHAVGGEEEMERARERLEGAGWIQSLKEPQLAVEALAAGEAR